jgi:hypothetical protein
MPRIVGGVRYSPEQNMVELVDQPRPGSAVAGTNVMGASAVGHPVRVPRIDAQPLQPQ